MQRGSVLKLIAITIVVLILAVFSYGPLKKPDTGIRLGLDIRGGVHLLLQAYPGPGQKDITKDDMDVARTVVEKRVNATGVSEPNIQIDYNNKRIYLDLAGIANVEEATRLLSTMAQLTFRDPNDESKVVLTGADLKDAKPGQDPQTGQYEVDLKFTPEGAKKFADLTSQNVGKEMAIYLDNAKQATPTISVPITNGQAAMHGGYRSLKDVNDIANMLRSGALPVSLKIEEKRQVGPTLGADSLMKSLNAAKWGIIFVFLFMLLWYRIPGLVADFSLIVYTLIVLWVMWSFKTVLTLPGLAGFILSIGMAVDFNIIIYERLKEELRTGKSLRAAIDHAFNRAFITVIDAHITTSITAIVLIMFTTGAVQGFAVTLLIGIISSLFTAVTFTRYILRIVARIKSEQNLKLYGL